MQPMTAARLCAPMAFHVLTIFAAAAPLAAQAAGDSVLVVVGDRVRASTADTTITGLVTRLTSGGFEVGQGEMRESFAYRDLDRLEVSQGMRSSWPAGAGIGFAVGGVVGFAQGEVPEGELGVALCALGGWLVVPWWCFGDFIEKGLIAAAIGGVAGAAIGALIKREAWEPIRLGDERVGFGLILTPQPRFDRRFGILAGGRIRF